MGSEPSWLWLRVGAVLVAALVLAGCGGGSTNDSGTEAQGNGEGSKPPWIIRFTESTTTSSSTTSTTSTTVETTTTTAPPPESTLPLVPTTVPEAPEPNVDPPPPVADPEGPPGRNSAFVIGDSVFLGTTRTIPHALPDWVVTYDAVGSRRLAQAIDLIAERRAEIGEAVVIHLGNNYIPGERGNYGTQIDEAMDLLRDVPRVVWVTVSEVSETRAEINRAIHEAATRWPNLRVADWAPIMAAEDGLSWDGIHLTGSGRARMAELVAEVLGPVPEG